MIDTISSVLKSVQDVVWGWGMIALLLGTHVFMTLRTGFIQKKVFKGIRLSVTKDPDAEGEVSQFGALTTALASTIGTGNIVGVAPRWLWAAPEPYSGVGLPASSALPPSTASL